MSDMSDMGSEEPKYRVEHASNRKATCNQAACKRAGSLIAKGELRIGTHTLFDRDGERRWCMAWRHWACATKHQLRGLKEVTNNDATKAPGYDRLSPESQAQLKLALEEGCIVDKTFKDIRPDLAAATATFGGEITNAIGYKIDMPTRPAGCRANECSDKIVKGELRVGFLKPFDGDHATWVYKHWNCISKYDIKSLKACYEQEQAGCPDYDDEGDALGLGGPKGLEGLDAIPTAFKDTVVKTFEEGELVTVAKSEPEQKPKKARAKKSKVEDKDSVEIEKPKRGRKKRAIEVVEAASDSEPEYVPKKTKSRKKVDEETADPAVCNIEALAAAMRENAGRG
ncbi:hypothetical protein E8E13_005936 [Curvularia kusanoi]|uniref:PARP-type domain-containing protein n=1 Tax=Curvularia kusanoi TaxID=90978 RepID=A0A9P4W4C4_CURKU|nr:hypothetical protein E8E13_005936 [Curvularia kusanoi]